MVVGCDDSAVDVKKIEESLQAHLRVRPTVELKKSEDVSAKMTKENGRKLVKFFDYRTG